MNSNRLLITERDNYGNRVLDPGDELLIRLPEQISGGYQWTVESVQTPVLELVADVESQASADAVGAPAMHEFVIRAKEPGTSEVRLRHGRAWEPAEAAMEKFKLRVEVRAKPVGT